jgi:hypothetical protein
MEIFMGLFDFLHGGKLPESEAEAYMRKRNKEYARKAAEYKRREAMTNITGKFGNDVQDMLYKNSRNNKVSSAASASLTSIGEAVGSIVKEFEKSLIEDACREARVRPTLNNCHECERTPSIYDGKEAALFEVDATSIKPAIRTVTASGKVLRGTFEVGDKVDVVTSVEIREATVAGVIRRGERAEYANSSSGAVGLVLNGVADMTIRKGDKIEKKRNVYFK